MVLSVSPVTTEVVPSVRVDEYWKRGGTVGVSLSWCYFFLRYDYNYCLVYLPRSISEMMEDFILSFDAASMDCDAREQRARLVCHHAQEHLVADLASVVAEYEYEAAPLGWYCHARTMAKHDYSEEWNEPPRAYTQLEEDEMPLDPRTEV